MSVEIALKQNILVTDFHLLKSLLVVFGIGSQVFICGFSRQNICSVLEPEDQGWGGLGGVPADEIRDSEIGLATLVSSGPIFLVSVLPNIFRDSQD